MDFSVPKAGEQVTAVRVSEDTLMVELLDGRSISAPLAWFPRLLHATEAQRQKYEVFAAGFGIHWPEIDEDISVQGLLAGAAAPGTRVSAA